MPLVLTDEPISWHAFYVWSDNHHGPGLTICRFRLSFDVPEVPAALILKVTADRRYRLLLNGQLIGRGPAKGTLTRYGVDTYDLAPLLRQGGNVLAAEVRWFGVNSPASEVYSPSPGFLVYCPSREDLCTPGEWRASPDLSVSADTTSYHDNAQRFLNHLDRVDFRLREAADWTAPEFDDSTWERPVPFGEPTNSGSVWGVADLRALHNRDIPLLSEEPKAFVKATTTGRRAIHVHDAPPVALTVPAGSGAAILLDAGVLNTGFPRLTFSGGRDREVRITYAEALGHWIDNGGALVWRKGQRDDPQGQAHGYRDTLFLSGRREVFEPFYWRTFWFILVEILPGPDACEFLSADYLRCVFPQSLCASFESSDPQAKTIVEVSWRTAQLCAHETYEDCPYYEQQNYIADSRLQALTSYYLANDTRLARRCLLLFRDSARYDGLIGSRVPTREPQVIPFFCFHWIFMLEDYWRWTGDDEAAFVRSCLPVVDGILTFFRERLRPDGFVGHLPNWNMVDRHPDWPHGEPPAVVAGESTYMTCLFIQALDVALRLHRQVGREEDAGRWEAWPRRLRRAVRDGAWDSDRGLYLEGPGRHADRCSQHTQCAAISAGVAHACELPALAERLFSDESLVRCHYMQAYYLARALETAGAYGRMHTEVLQPWRDMLAQNTSAWWEYPDPTRSDCHGWSAWVATDYLSAVLGIKPLKPGWRAIALAPQFDGLEWASGEMSTPAGRIKVEWRRDAEGISLEATTPPGVPVELKLPELPAEWIAEGGNICRHIPCPAGV